MGEAFARELDRAEANLGAALGDLEQRLAQAERALAEKTAEADRERTAGIETEARLKAFEDLALR